MRKSAKTSHKEIHEKWITSWVFLDDMLYINLVDIFFLKNNGKSTKISRVRPEANWFQEGVWRLRRAGGKDALHVAGVAGLGSLKALLRRGFLWS